LFALAVGSAVVSTAPALAASKQETGYRDRPNSGRRCSSCQLFVGPAGCRAVEGTISPNGWCQFWTPR
jgi:hypothetical protein